MIINLKNCTLKSNLYVNNAPSYEGDKPLYQSSDFTFIGTYAIPASVGGQLTYGQGLTHRYKDGQLHFLTFGFSGNGVPSGTNQAILQEFAAPASISGVVSGFTGTWLDIFTPLSKVTALGFWHTGLWWEDMGGETGRLWVTDAVDYPQTTESEAYTRAISVRNLESSGVISNVHGKWGLEGLQQRRYYGGMQPIPEWFQIKYKTGKYAIGWGGYASRISLGISQGLFFASIPDPLGYGDGAEVNIPPTAYKVGSDFATGAALNTDWYASGVITTFDRGARGSGVINYYNDLTVPQNPPESYYDENPVSSGAGWLSPAPDGFGRQVWGDSYYNTGCWINGVNKHGFITVLTCAQKKTGYVTSQLWREEHGAEIHIFDPNKIGSVMNGQLSPWKCQPTYLKDITNEFHERSFLTYASDIGEAYSVKGATFDSLTNRLYMLVGQKNGAPNDCAIFIYGVNDN